MSDEDQAQESEQTDSSESQTEDKQDAQGTEQSDQKGEEGKNEPKLYKLPDGRELTADEVYKEHTEKLLPEFTRRSQRLAKFEKAEEEAKSEAGQQAREAVAKDDLLKDVDPSVREAITRIVEPIIQQRIGGLKEETAQSEKDKAFKAELGSLETKYPGGDGRPKFERSKILAKMREEDNRDFNPETVYEKLHRKELFDYEVKQALKKQKGGSQLETTGGDESGKPQAKTPKTFAEAANAARSRV